MTATTQVQSEERPTHTAPDVSGIELEVIGDIAAIRIDAPGEKMNTLSEKRSAGFRRAFANVSKMPGQSTQSAPFAALPFHQ